MTVSSSSHSAVRRNFHPEKRPLVGYSSKTLNMGKLSTAGFFILVTILATSFAMELPNNWKTCNRLLPDDQYYDCIAEAAQDAVLSLAKGLKSFKILPIEPLAVDSMKIGGLHGSVSLRQEYKNIKIHGLTKNLKISNCHIDWDKCLIAWDTYSSQVDFVADYKLDGKVLLLPIRGSGRSNITLYDLKSGNEIYCEKIQKNGETYLRTKKYLIKFNPERVNLAFDNLFEGDPVLGDQMNRFINENSDLLFKELQGAYEETFGLIFAKISNDVFSHVPMNELFPTT